jgi:hypothetical protein
LDGCDLGATSLEGVVNVGTLDGSIEIPEVKGGGVMSDGLG